MKQEEMAKAIRSAWAQQPNEGLAGQYWYGNPGPLPGNLWTQVNPTPFTGLLGAMTWGQPTKMQKEALHKAGKAVHQHLTQVNQDPTKDIQVEVQLIRDGLARMRRGTMRGELPVVEAAERATLLWQPEKWAYPLIGKKQFPEVVDLGKLGEPAVLVCQECETVLERRAGFVGEPERAERGCWLYKGMRCAPTQAPKEPA